MKPADTLQVPRRLGIFAKLHVRFPEGLANCGLDEGFTFEPALDFLRGCIEDLADRHLPASRPGRIGRGQQIVVEKVDDRLCRPGLPFCSGPFTSLAYSEYG